MQIFSLIWTLAIIEPMVNSLLVIYKVLGNFGVAIILFTILIRLITHPLSVQQINSGHKMQELQRSKEWQEIQKKYKDDKAQLQQEQMKIYKEKGINPLGSCLPTLIQFPIIIGLYQAIIRVLGGSPVQLIELFNVVYKFPLFTKYVPIAQLIPINNQFLWMDLSQPEKVYILGFGIPVLAIIVVATTWLQSRLMTPPSQPGDQGAQMSQMMNLYMPLLMGYLALTFAAGLAVYFVTSNVFTIGQYAAMGKVDWKNVLPGKKAPPQVVNVKEKTLKTPPKASTAVKPGKAKTSTSKGKVAK
jgi:YidC/Oxa1 family membrane protein insertase